MPTLEDAMRAFPTDVADDPSGRVGEMNALLADAVLAMLESAGERIGRVERGDAFLMYRGAANSRVEFEVKGLPMPGWKFGMWVDSTALLAEGEADDEAGEEPVAVVFARHSWLADKFDPMSAPFVFEWTLDAVRWWLARGDADALPWWHVRPVLSFIDEIRSHPLVAYGRERFADGYIAGPSPALMYARDALERLSEAIGGGAGED